MEFSKENIVTNSTFKSNIGPLWDVDKTDLLMGLGKFKSWMFRKLSNALPNPEGIPSDTFETYEMSPIDNLVYPYYVKSSRQQQKFKMLVPKPGKNEEMSIFLDANEWMAFAVDLKSWSENIDSSLKITNTLPDTEKMSLKKIKLTYSSYRVRSVKYPHDGSMKYGVRDKIWSAGKYEKSENLGTGGKKWDTVIITMPTVPKELEDCRMWYFYVQCTVPIRLCDFILRLDDMDDRDKRMAGLLPN
ncbi:hypothetical protein [Okeania sp. SIO1F9]|uniref:hypothetical protein n=1 Tax=Okeania sp. SIO1F9 TaxID=2607813 RepID=UPI00144C91B5|nr:hypothetical protein [Okeania sp. SIO1F9]NET78950.1 hypothetical protein [Okeania sp. SIO1F9]